MGLTEMERYKRDQARAYLERIRTRSERIAALERSIESLRERAEGIAAVDYSIPKTASPGDDGSIRLAEYVDRVDELAASWGALMEEWLQAVQEASSCALRMEDPTECAVIMDYYILPKGDWNAVAELNGYSLQGVMSVRTRALISFFDVMPKDKGGCLYSAI